MRSQSGPAEGVQSDCRRANGNVECASMQSDTAPQPGAAAGPLERAKVITKSPLAANHGEDLISLLLPRARPLSQALPRWPLLECVWENIWPANERQIRLHWPLFWPRPSRVVVAWNFLPTQRARRRLARSTLVEKWRGNIATSAIDTCALWRRSSRGTRASSRARDHCFCAHF